MPTLAVVDVETTLLADGQVPRTLFWGLAVEGEEYRRFNRTRDLWRFLEQRESVCPGGLVLLNHHDFDVIQALVDGAPLTIHRVRGGRVLLATGPGKTEWRNSYALYPTALKDILESAGFVKKELGDLEARNYGDTVEALIAFRKLDEAYGRVWGIRPLESGSLTAAGVASKAAVSVAGPVPEYVQHRKAYRGGRTEAFRLGPCGTSRLLDINSSYPYSFRDAPSRDRLLYLDVDISADPSPFHLLDETKLVFPCGRYRTCVWESNYERYIRPHGGVKIRRVAQAVKCDLRWVQRVGAKLIDRAYSLRAQAKARGDAALAYCAKIGLNSIYGRLGLRPLREVAVTGTRVPEGDDLTYYALPGNRYLTFMSRLVPVRGANYLFAGYVTDNARARLYDAMARAGSRLLYVDTDSVYLKGAAPEGIRTGDSLGAWKEEGEGELSIVSVKDYTFGKKEKRKGGRKNYQWTVRRALKGDGVLEVEKTRQTAYDKRIVLPSGRTLPITL